MRTSNDADYLLPRSTQDTHHALDEMIRGQPPQSIFLDNDFTARSRARALAAMPPPAVMH